MTGKELTKAVRAIWRQACKETAALVKAQKYKVFDSQYSFHRYIKHGKTDGIIEGGADLLTLFMQGRVNGKDLFVIGTPENVESERKKCLDEKIDWCRSQLDYGKNCIIENEIELRSLIKKKKREDDRQRKIKAVHGVHRKNRKSPRL